jgi:hypothetical protein
VLTARFRSVCLGRLAERANFRAVESKRHSFSLDVLSLYHLLFFIEMVPHVGKALFSLMNQLIAKVRQQTKHLISIYRLSAQVIKSVDEQGRLSRVVTSRMNFRPIKSKTIHPLLEEFSDHIADFV